MRYLTLAEAVTGLEMATLARASRLELLDSALHARQAGFGDEDFYPDPEQKAAVLTVHIAMNHPLPDGNKRLAWQSLTIFLALNGCFGFQRGVRVASRCQLGLPAWRRTRIR